MKSIRLFNLLATLAMVPAFAVPYAIQASASRSSSTLELNRAETGLSRASLEIGTTRRSRSIIPVGVHNAPRAGSNGSESRMYTFNADPRTVFSVSVTTIGQGHEALRRVKPSLGGDR